jgi:hypothetical protein
MEPSLRGAILRPDLADTMHPEGLGFCVDSFDEDLIEGRDRFARITADLRQRFGAVTIPGLTEIQQEYILNSKLWRWGHTGNRPVDRVPHVDFNASIGLFAHADTPSTESPRVLGVTTFERGCLAYASTLLGMINHDGSPLPQETTLRFVKCFIDLSQLSSQHAVRSTVYELVQMVRNAMPSNDPHLAQSALFPTSFEEEFVDRMCAHFGIHSPQNTLLHVHRKGTLVAVSGDVFHFSAGGNLESGTVRITRLD